MNKKLLTFLATGSLMLSMGSAASASIIYLNNPGFESGDFTGWNVNIPDANYGYALVVPNDIAYWTPDASVTSVINPYSGSYTADLYGTTNISQNISWNAGDRLIFAYDFKSNNVGPINDYGYFQVLGAGNTVLYNQVLGSTTSVGGGLESTGWTYVDYAFTTSGSGAVNFGVQSLNDPTVGLSQLYVDSPTPEPASMLLLGTGLAGLAGKRLRRKKK